MPKKYLKNLVLVAAILLVSYIVLVWVQSNVSNSSFIPKLNLPFISSRKLVSLGEEFTLRKGETAQVKGLNAFLKITEFTNSPCPTNVLCKWSGLNVAYEFTVDGKIYNYSSAGAPGPHDISYEAPYDVFVKDSDYKSFAKFTIDKIEAKCLKLREDSDGLCWRGLAQRFKDANFCQKIVNSTDKDRCLENMAEYLQQKDLCTLVQVPKRFCQYLNIIDQNDLSQCFSYNDYMWQVKCIKEFAKQTGNGVDICNTLEPSRESFCKDAISRF